MTRRCFGQYYPNVGTAPRYVSDAKRIAKESPEVLEKVWQGELTNKKLGRWHNEKHVGVLVQLFAQASSNSPDEEIGEKLGITHQAVSVILAKNGHLADFGKNLPFDWNDRLLQEARPMA